MKLLMTADTIGGVWTYALELCQGLCEHGVEVALATMGRSLNDDQLEQVGVLGNIQLYESTFKLEWMPTPWDDVRRAGNWLLEIERQCMPDVVHLNGYAHGTLPWQAPVVMVGHSCVLSWWQAVKGELAPAEWTTYRERVSQGLHAAHSVIAPTRAMLDALCRHYISLPRSRVIANGRAASLFHIGRKEPFILSAGRLWDEGKNVAALERIADQLRWPVRVAGETHVNGERRELSVKRTEWLGRLNTHDMSDQMARAAIYCLPARYEPFGLSVLEAALSGCALVLGDIESLREVWGDAAIFVKPDDSSALVQALSQLIDQPVLRDSMAAKALGRAACFSSERMAASYLSTYREIINAAASAQNSMALIGGACAS